MILAMRFELSARLRWTLASFLAGALAMWAFLWTG